MAPADLASAICTGDLARLTKLPGVGKKTAERLCLELKDKVQFTPAAESALISPAQIAPEDQQSADVISALVNLGYSPVNARKAVEKVREAAGGEGSAQLSLEELLRLALRSLA
jgi:Holliday junction DNA helicase RuvA